MEPRMNFSVREFGLPSLLSEAAVDVDNRIKGGADERESIKELRDIFYEWQEKGNRGFEESTLFTEAIRWENFGLGKKSNKSEVPLKLNLLLKDLDSYEKLPIQGLETLRGFCVDLSRGIGNHYDTYYGRNSRMGFA